jgi:uroporphyrinogen-III decarboxylase
MTSKDRLLTVLTRGIPDRIPWSPLIEGFFLSGLKKQRSLLDALREIGADFMIRKVPVFSSSIFKSYEVSQETRVDIPVKKERNNNIDIIEEKDPGRIARTYITKYGKLHEEWIIKETSPAIPFPTEYLIKTADDIKIYRHLLEQEEISAYYDIFLSMEKEIGGEGLATTVVPHTPLQHLLIIHMGIENFYYKLNDFQEEIEALMNDMHWRNKEICKIIAESPAEVAIEYENTGITYVSPQIYKTYEKPAIDDYGKILHAADKIFLVHMCGKIRKLADFIKNGEQDGVCDIAPNPTGDWELSEAHNALHPEQIVMGGLDSMRIHSNTVDEIKKYTKNILETVTGKNGLILGNGDSILMGTPMENLKAITETVEEFGIIPAEVK